MEADEIKKVVEGALMAAGEPLTVERIVALFEADTDAIAEVRAGVRDALKALTEESEGRGFELHRVGSGYRFQVPQALSPWISRLWAERPPRYSRALMETLALVAYRQPVTRGDIEQVRGVAVSQNIIRTLLERGWVREVGVREVPGRPALYGTTRAFLDYFNIASLDQLPALPEIRALIEPAVDDGAPPAATGEDGVTLSLAGSDADADAQIAEEDSDAADNTAGADAAETPQDGDADAASEPAGSAEVDSGAGIDVEVSLDSSDGDEKAGVESEHDEDGMADVVPIRAND
ncbi:MAG: SMC-Scp complex subunit ScpB [Pseudomonadaceae bacterium]|nr:SMC-Scp complex subunit ScpB [Pseudomonadaceae bacterium]